MHRRVWTLLLGSAAVLLLPMCSKKHHDPTPHDYGVVVNSIPGLAEDFIKGADVSMLAQIEAKGGKFYDEDGTEKDCLKILQQHGVNWVRLRLWNAPVIAHDFTPEPGYPVYKGESAAGINDLARDIELARRAKALGMKVLLDFHYSDWWADPQKQFPPQAWEEMTLDQTKEALHAFTKDAVTRMRAQGAGPDMVQVGNEIRNGMLWPLGFVNNVHANEGVYADPSTYDDLAALVGEGVRAVREVDPAIRIMIHLDRGGDNTLARLLFGALIARGVDFDVMGFSYYPTWHGTMAELRQNLVDVSQYFGKPVVIAETSYPWTTENADSLGNNIDGTAMLTDGPDLPTVQGQTTFLRDVMDIVASVPYGRGLGIFYWEPDWIAVEGAGWYTRGADGWDNQTMFDHAGKALPSLNVFRAVSEDRPWVEAKPISVPAQRGITTKTGVAVALPDSARVFFDDGSLRELYVVWDELPAGVWTVAGTTALHGTIPAAPDLDVALTIVVTGMTNAGFEDGMTGWTVTANPTPSELGSFAKDVRSGSRTLHWWNATAFDFTVEQTVTGLESGKTYTLAFYAMGEAGQPMHAFAYCPPDAATPSVYDFTLTGWPNKPEDWLHPTITGLDGSAGSCRVGVSSSVRAGDWGSVDDFSLTAE